MADDGLRPFPPYASFIIGGGHIGHESSLEEAVPPDAEVLAGLSAYVRNGYLVALDDFVFDESLRPLIELAHIIKIDLRALSRPALEEQVRLLRAWDVKLEVGKSGLLASRMAKASARTSGVV
ncbi:hypothetical protein THITH_01685 [Thioalkalivibrio paradoxus ARh 1]|uniref:EAL domain-containing protein n=1 Tax=Thioalkalivibrio paradoxus ARh 1 TaxID=713585 RepID=W0DSL7_9GAMM|nr:hypothetical protein THITH_01685 [Thioalkalivibrio paradoxus ARh 1]